MTYHEQSHYCRVMIGHSLGRMGGQSRSTPMPSSSKAASSTCMPSRSMCTLMHSNVSSSLACGRCVARYLASIEFIATFYLYYHTYGCLWPASRWFGAINDKWGMAAKYASENNTLARSRARRPLWSAHMGSASCFSRSAHIALLPVFRTTSSI